MTFLPTVISYDISRITAKHITLTDLQQAAVNSNFVDIRDLGQIQFPGTGYMQSNRTFLKCLVKMFSDNSVV